MTLKNNDEALVLWIFKHRSGFYWDNINIATVIFRILLIITQVCKCENGDVLLKLYPLGSIRNSEKTRTPDPIT